MTNTTRVESRIAGPGGAAAPPIAWIISEPLAGLQAQALGLAEAAGLSPSLRALRPRWPWRYLPSALWPAPLRAVDPAALAPPLPQLLIGCGGMAATVGRHLRSPRLPMVQVQNPRMNPARFDLVVAARHDRISGPNVIYTRTALHRVTPARLAEAAAIWAPRFAALKRPLVAVLVGGSNGRFRFGEAEGEALARQLAGMMHHDNVGVVVTPSRRTDPIVARHLAATLMPLEGWVWDGTGDNPYFGLLALADAIVVTTDSVSMVSEAVATQAPVMLASLPGRSRRITAFIDEMLAAGRVRRFRGAAESWPVQPLDDTAYAADEMRRRLGF